MEALKLTAAALALGLATCTPAAAVDFVTVNIPVECTPHGERGRDNLLALEGAKVVLQILAGETEIVEVVEVDGEIYIHALLTNGALCILAGGPAISFAAPSKGDPA